jgi:hypothetical protein
VRRLICLLAACALAGCASTSGDIEQEIKDNPPSAAGPGRVAIWMSSAAPVLPKWPRVKTWTGTIARCARGEIGPEVSATTDDGLPVAIRVLNPSGQQARLVAFIQYAPDGTPPRNDQHDEQLLIVSDQPFSSAEAGATKGDFSGGFTHAPTDEPPPADSSGTIAQVSWQCPSG